jgi:heme A synthase
MERIALLHSRLPFTTTALLVVLLLWGLVDLARGRVGQGLLALLWMAQLLVIAQSILGILLLLSNFRRPDLALHLIYGLLSVTFLPAALIYFREREGHRAVLTLLGCAFVLLILLLRTIETVG